MIPFEVVITVGLCKENVVSELKYIFDFLFIEPKSGTLGEYKHGNVTGSTCKLVKHRKNLPHDKGFPLKRTYNLRLFYCTQLCM